MLARNRSQSTELENLKDLNSQLKAVYSFTLNMLLEALNAYLHVFEAFVF